MDPNQPVGEVVLTEVYNQDEAQLISGLLMMAGIPVKLGHETCRGTFWAIGGAVGHELKSSFRRRNWRTPKRY